MEAEANGRREFLKRATTAGAVVLGTGTLIAATTESQHRGSSVGSGNGVVVGRSKKNEILYRKTQNWEEYYKRAV